jgi:HlyD family secretion protein
LTKAPERDVTNKNVQRLWVLDKGQAVAVSVTTGATDGTMTEVTGGELKPGMEVIVDSISQGK